MVAQCIDRYNPPLTDLGLREYLSSRVDRNRDEIDRVSDRLNDWYSRPGSTATKGMNAAFNRIEAELEVSLIVDEGRLAHLYEFVVAEFVRNYSSGLTRLDGSRAGPVFILDNAFAIADSLAAGRIDNAQILHNQALSLLDQRAYTAQELYAEDLERKKDPGNFVEIIPQRLFVFVHELMGLRAGQAKQPWAKWDIVGDRDYIDAARAVYTEDPDLAAATVCKLCNLHVQYSNPFPKGDNDDHFTGVEFDTPIRSLWPTEIFAWLRLRQERGLPLPEVEHPLLEQRLGRFDPEITRSWQPERWFAEFVDRLAQFNPRYKDLPSLVFGTG